MSQLVSCLLTKTTDKSQREISKRIEQQLKDDKKIARTQVKLLVLGTSESGKSTFLKQMRIIHGAGYSDEERLTFVPLISRNIHTSMKTLIKSMKYLSIKFETDDNERLAQLYEESESEEECKTISRQVGEDFQRLWKDAGVKQCYSRRDEFQLSDSTGYFMSHLERITEKGYIPSIQDVLRSRLPTSGIREYQFDIGNFVFGIVDVGGQKSERRKWIHCFENVTSIIFLAALSEYNMTIPLEEVSQDLRASLRHRQRRIAMRARTALNNTPSSSGMGASNGLAGLDLVNGHSPHNQSHRKIRARQSQKKPFQPTGFPRPLLTSSPSSIPEGSPDQNGNMRKESDDSTYSADPALAPSHINRMKESRALFKTIITCEYFHSTSVILFLNKKDILAEKILTSHIADHFPEFDGPRCNEDAARNFILTKYADCFERRRTPKRDLYAHFTCATDTRNIKFVFAAVKDIILKNYLITYNLV